jgi:hypothetical protein
MRILLGCDPEAFVWDRKKFINPHEILPGTKETPHKTEFGSLYSDSLRYKFNIIPTYNQDHFVRNIRNTMNEMENVVKKIDKSLKVLFTPWALFDQVEYTKFKIVHKNWDQGSEWNQKGEICFPQNLNDKNFRIAGGHVHLGWAEAIPAGNAEHRDTCRRIAETCGQHDLFKPNSVFERKRLLSIGKQVFRPKPYGMELRYVSSRWIKHTETIKQMYFVLNNYAHAVLG